MTEVPNVTTIYDAATAFTIADGLQSSLVCDEAFNIARGLAKERRKSVIVEDLPAQLIYRITPSGKRMKPPKWWGGLTA